MEIDPRDEDHRTPLMIAVQQHSLKIIKLLLDSGADINAVDNQGYTPFILAADTGQIETA